MDLLPSLRGASKAPELPRVVEVPVPQHDPEDGEGDDQLPQFLRKPNIPRPPLAVFAAEGENGSSALQSVNPSAVTQLTPEAIKLLQATLNELGECRRMLDAARERD